MVEFVGKGSGEVAGWREFVQRVSPRVRSMKELLEFEAKSVGDRATCSCRGCALISRACAGMDREDGEHVGVGEAKCVSQVWAT